ncbi:MAG: pentapeptide repeat-containing protein, partial [Acidimicrobiales bacterium]|nr:pentapeptide repeat-containing protein [Acidimicrobiales bacterium]
MSDAQLERKPVWRADLMHNTSRSKRLVVAMLVALLAGPVALVAPTAAQGTGTLSGTVTDPGGAPLAGLTVEARHWFWGVLVDSTTTGVDGTYTLTLEPDDYRVRVLDPGGTWPERWSGDVGAWEDSTAVAVTDGGTTTLDVAYPPADSISGVVTGDAVPLAGIDVELLNLDNWPVASTSTAVDGTYAFANLMGGPYRVRFTDPTGIRAGLHNSGSRTRAGAPEIEFVGGATHVVDVDLPLSATVGGDAAIGEHPNKALLAAGAFSGDSYPSPEGVYVVVLDAATTEIIGLGLTDATGHWSVGSLAPGDVKVGYLHPAYFTANPEQGYRPVFAGGHDVLAEGLFGAFVSSPATPVPVAATVDTGTQHLTGWDCDPTVYVPGADLTGADLAGKRLAGCDLAGATFDGADAEHVDLTLADLQGATFAGADLLPATLNGADLRGADLTGQVLLHRTGGGIWPWPPSPEEVYEHTLLQGALVENASFNGAYVASADLCLTWPDWSGTNMGATEARFDLYLGWVPSMPVFSQGIASPFPGGLGLSPAAVEGFCQAPGVDADFSEFTVPPSAQVGPDWGGRDLHGMACNLCSFPSGTTFAGSDLTGASLAQSFLGGADLTGTTLTGAVLRSAKLTNAVGLTGAQLLATDDQWDAIDLSGTGVDLSGADLTGHTLAGARLSGIDLSGADLSGVNLTGAVLTATDLTGANLTGTILTDADLTGAVGVTAPQLLAADPDWTGIDIDGTGVDLSGAD